MTGRRTPLYEKHLGLGAKMVDFAGWKMPVQYQSVIKEHMAVREGAGLFDVSHMGEIEVYGEESGRYLNGLLTNDLGRVRVGGSQYSVACNESGGVLDDLLVYRVEEERFLIVVNAANKDKMFAHFLEKSASGITVRDRSNAWALLALQGPGSEDVVSSTPLGRTLPEGWREMKKNRWLAVPGADGYFCTTGYTGESGFEILIPSGRAAEFWDLLVSVQGVVPAGLAARDTLRFEASYCLYGHELTEDVTPLEAGLGWAVKMEKGDFLGRKSLMTMKERGVPRRLMGFEVIGRSIAREGTPVLLSGNEVGRVTSGTYAPYLKRSLAMALVDSGAPVAGDEWAAEIRGKLVPMRAASMPFYRR